MALLLCALVAPAAAYGQSRTLKDAIRGVKNDVDYTSKTLKVVLKGDNSVSDLALKDAVERNWTITPYEFTDYKEYDKIEADTSFLFLMFLKQDTGTPAKYLSIFRGDPTLKTKKGLIDFIFELPISGIGEEEEAGLPYIPLYVKAMQNRVRDHYNTLVGIMPHSGEINEMDMAEGKEIYMTEDEYVHNVSTNELKSLFGSDVEVVTREQMDSLATSESNVLIARSLLVKGESFGNKSCNIVFDLRSGTIRYLNPVQLMFGRKLGFTKRELMAIAHEF